MNDRTINIMVVDDEPIAREILINYISRIPGLQLCAACGNAIEAAKGLDQHQVDILLLDINMPEITGMQLLKSLPHPPLVIFTTAYAEYAVQSYELNAVDYLLKPIPFSRFGTAIDKATALLLPRDRTAAAPAYIFLRSEGRLIRLNVDDLVLAEGLKDYIRLWTAEGKIVVHQTMKNFEEQLAAFPVFVRVHKSYIVNISFVLEVHNTSLKIKDQLIPVGNTYRERTMQLIQEYISRK